MKAIILRELGGPKQVLYEEVPRIRPVIDKTFPLEQASEALVYMEKGENFGKIILSVSS